MLEQRDPPVLPQPPRLRAQQVPGGALAFADPDEGFAFAFTPSRTLLTPAGPGPDPLAALIDALYR